MMHLTTRELLYLEDITKLFESVERNCSRGSQSSNDPQLQSLLEGLAQDHQDWMGMVSAIVAGNGTLQ